MSTMYCPNCGKQTSEVQNFCENCGSALKPEVTGHRHAPLLYRIIAYLIDIFILLIPLTIIILSLLYGTYGEAFLEPTELTSILEKEMVWLGLISSLIFFLYFTLLEGKFQATIGKKLLGIHIVKKDMTPSGFRQSVVRNALRLIWDLPFLGLVMIFLDILLIFTRHQRLGDIVAGTYVMRK